MKQLRFSIYIITSLMGLLCGCTSDHITITYELGDICITRQMYSHHSILSYSSSTCSDAGHIIIKERKGEYEAMLAIDTCRNIVYVTSQGGCTELIPKHIDTTVWCVKAPDNHTCIELYGEQQVAYLDYVLSGEIYKNSGFYDTRSSRKNTHWHINYPNHSKWNLDNFGYIGGLYLPAIMYPNADDSVLVLQFVENEIKNLQYASLSSCKHDFSQDIIKKGCDGCQLFHVYYECSNGNGEVILVKDSANNIIDHLNIVLQSNDTIPQAGKSIIYERYSRVNSWNIYASVSVETTRICSECPFDTVVTRTQYDLIDGHYISHPVNDIFVYEKP